MTYVDKVTLERMYVRQRRPTAEIARTLGVSQARVRDSLTHHGIPLRDAPQDGRLGAYLNSDEVVRLYGNGLSIAQISRALMVNPARISQVLHGQGVELRSQGTVPEGIVHRRGVAWEKLPVRETRAGVQYRWILRLECGHKHTPAKAWLQVQRQVDPTTLTVSCSTCRKLGAEK